MTQEKDSAETPEAAAAEPPPGPAGESVATPAPRGKAKAAVDSDAPKPEGMPRRVFFRLVTFSWAHFLVIVAIFGGWFTRFLFPNVRFEPPSRFRIGKPDDFALGVSERFKKRNGVWIVRSEKRIYALSTTCTHLGCTPNWLPAEEKFKCPCHGSGFASDGVNFEGPAPRPLERYGVSLDDAGEIVVDKSVAFRQERAEWDRPGSYLPV
jgi:cytochrome b6-f complex iron-sulfur subunit